jgi:hypothetical protein
MTGVVATALTVIVSATFLRALELVLDFGQNVMARSGGKSESLLHAAELVRVFLSGSGGLLSLLSKIFMRG